MDVSWNYDYPQIARESGFRLKQTKKGSLDWRLISSIEIERVISEQGFERIEAIVPHLSEAPLGFILESQILESGIAKYFCLSQLGLQYLLFCKKFLDETVNSLKESLEETQRENLRLKEMYQESNEELLEMHKKFQRFEKMSEIVFPCSLCTKNFVSNEMLNTHMNRKHSKSQADIGDNASLGGASSTIADRNLINTIKLELEIKQLKERLNATEKSIKEQQQQQPQQYHPQHPQQEKQLANNENNQSISIDSSNPTDKNGFTCDNKPQRQGSKDHCENGGGTFVLNSPNQSPKRDSPKFINNIETDIGEENNKTVVTCNAITQSEITDRKSVGIQSNFTDDKEIDDVVDVQLKENSQILDELKEKISNFENWKNQEIQMQQDSVKEIKDSLHEIVQTIEKKHHNEIENLEKMINNFIVTANNNNNNTSNCNVNNNDSKLYSPTTHMEQIQKFLGESMLNLHRDYEDKLNNIVEKIENSYAENLHRLSDEIKTNQEKNLNDILRPIQEARNEEIKNLNKFPTSKIPILKQRDSLVNFKETTSKKPVTEKSSNPSVRNTLKKSNLVDITKYKKSSSSSSVDTETFTAQQPAGSESESSTSLKEEHLYPEVVLQAPQEIKSKSSEKTSSSKKIPTKPNRKPEKMNLIDIHKIVAKRLDSVGIEVRTKALSSSAFHQVSNLIIKKQKFNKKRYPKYNQTRDKIKTVVNKLLEQKLNIALKSVNKEVTKKSPQHTKDTNRKNIDNLKDPEDIVDDWDNRPIGKLSIKEDYKLRLEKILNSPIKKPTINGNDGPQRSKTLFPVIEKEDDESVTESVKNPVPLPRKRVVFGIPSGSGTNFNGDKSLLQQEKRNSLSNSSVSSL